MNQLAHKNTKNPFNYEAGKRGKNSRQTRAKKLRSKSCPQNGKDLKFFDKEDSEVEEEEIK